MGWSRDKWEMINWQREQIPGSWRGNRDEEHRKCDLDCIKSNLPRNCGKRMIKNIDIRTGEG